MENKINRLEKKFEIFETSVNQTLDLIKNDIKKLQENQRVLNTKVNELVESKAINLKQELYKAIQASKNEVNEKLLVMIKNLKIDYEHQIASLKSEISIYKNLVNQELEKIKEVKKVDDKKSEDYLDLKNEIDILSKKMKKLEVLSDQLDSLIG